MRSLKRRIALLLRRAADWRRFLQEHGDGALHPDSSSPVRREGDQTLAVFELAVTLAQLEETVAAFRYFWPTQDQWSERVGKTARNAAEAFADAAAAPLPAVLGARVRHLAEEDMQSLEDVVDGLLEWRQLVAVAKSSLIPVDFRVRGLDLLALPARLDAAIERLSSDDRAELSRAIRSYLSNQWLYRWVSTEGEIDTLGRRYESLFRIANLTAEGTSVNGAVKFDDVLSVPELDENIKEQCKQVLTRISEIIEEDGYEALWDILDDGGFPGGPEAAPNANVIPGRGHGTCRPILIAFSKGGGSKAKSGSIQVMRQVREALIECAGTTQVVIFIGPHADVPKAIEESMLDIEAHLGRSVLKAFVPLGEFNGQLSHIRWRR